MNIGLEAKRFFSNRTGLGNYSRFIVDALSENFPEQKYFLYTPTARAPKDAMHILERPCVRVVTPSPFYSFSKSLWRSWAVSYASSIKDINLFHGLSQELPISLPSHVKKIVTVHDLIFYRYPAFYNSFDVRIYKKKVAYACERADRIIAVSQQTKDDIVHYLGVDAKKISVVYQGCHFNFNRTTSEEERKTIRAKFGMPAEYILNVGTIEERKNIVVLIDALGRMPKSRRIPLVVIGRQSAYFKQVQEAVIRAGVQDDVHFLENVPFSDFPAIYQGASLFVYPSLFEGFGIPLIEAITSKIPVITSTGSCFSEAAGPDASYVNPSDPEMLASEIQKILSDNILSETMIRRSFEYIQRFRPAVIAEEINHIYHSV